MLTNRARFRAALACIAVLIAGVTCTEGTGPRNRAAVALVPTFSPAAVVAWSNVVSSGLAVDNIHITLKHADGTAAADTVVAYAGEDSLVIELTADVTGSSETLVALIEMRDGTLVLFSGTANVLAVAGTIPQTPPQVPMEFTGPGATVTSIDIGPADTAIIAIVDSIKYVPTAKDQGNQNVADFAILWSLSDSTIGTISSTGVFRGLVRGQTWVKARTFTGVKDSAHVTVSLPATKLVVVSGNAQTGVAGTQLPLPVVIEAQASDNLPVPGVTVTFVPPAGTTPAQTVFVTAANGRISLSIPVNTTAGANNFSFTSVGLTGVALTSTATADLPSKLAMSQQPSATASSGVTLVTQPKVQLQDKFGNSAAVAGKPVVAALTTPAGRTLTGTATVNTDANGVATFTNLAVSGPTGSFTLKFTQDTLTAATSNSIALDVGTAAKVVLETRPSATGTNGVAFVQQPVARITDAAGNTITSSSANVTVAASAGYSLGGTLIIAAVNGVATFTNVAATGPAGAALLTFSSGALASDTASVTLSAGTATRVKLTTRPSAAANSGALLAQQPIAQIVDASGNVVSSSSASVTVTGSAGYSVSGSATIAAGAGVVTFTGLALNGPTGNALLTFTSSGLTVDTATVAVTQLVGAPASITATSPVAFVDTIQANVGSANLPTVVVKDAQNVLVPGVAVKFRLYGGPGSLLNGLSDTVMVNTDANGVAKLTSQRLSDSISVDSITATTATLSDTVKFLAGVLNGAPHHMVILAQPSDVEAGQMISVLVGVQDRLGNPAVFTTGAPPNITIAIRSGFGTAGAVLSPNPNALTQPTTSSIATFEVAIDLVGSDYALTASSPGMTSIHTSDFQVTAAGPGVTWINPSGGNWSTPGNWSTGLVPTSADIVGIDLDGTYTVTLDVNATVAGLIVGSGTGNATLSASSKTLTINGPAATTGDGIIVLTNSTINGSGFLENVGTIYAHGASALNIGFENAVQGELIVQGQASGGNAVLTVLNSFTNHHTIELTSANAGYNAQLTLTNGTLTNDADGTISVLIGTGGTRTLTAQLVNNGTVTLGKALTLSKASANHVNNGTIDNTIDNLIVTQSGTTPSFTNTGTITLGANRDISITGGSADFSSGTVTGAVNSVLIVQNTTLAFSPSTILVPLQLNGTSPIVGGAVTVASGETFRMFAGTLSATLDVQAGGTVYGRGTWSGAVTNAGTINVQGQAFGGNATLTVSNGFTNDGLIYLTSQDAGYSSTLNVTNGTLVNSSTGTITSLAGTGGARTLAAQLDNQGILDVDAALTMSKASAAHVNSGTIDLTTANLIVSHSGTTPSFTNNGNVTLGANRTFTVQNAGALDLSGGTVSGTPTSTLVANSQAMTFTPPNVTIPMTLLSTTVNGGSLVIGGDEDVILLGGGLNGPVTINGGGTLYTHGTVSLISLTTVSNSLVIVRGQSNGGHASLTVSNGFTNTGVINLTSQDAGYTSTLAVTTGTLTNAAGATIHTLAGAGGSRTLAAVLDNQGTLDVDQPLNLGKTGAQHTNSGAIDLTVANLALDMTGGSGLFTNSGTVTLAAGRDFTVVGGTLNLSAGSVSGTPTSTLIVTAGSVAFLTSTVTIPMTLISTGTGAVTIPNGETLTLLQGALNAPVTIESGGTLLTHGSVALNGAVTLPTGGTLRVRGQGNGGHATLTVANGFANNGLIDLTSVDAGYSAALDVTAGTLTNAAGATIHSIVGAGGGRTLSAQLDNQGTLDVDQALVLDKALANHLNSGAIDLANASLTINQSGAGASFTNVSPGTVTLAANRALSFSGGTVDLSGGTVSGTPTSTLFVASAVLAFTTASVTIPMTLNSTNISSGSVAIPTGQTLTLLNGGLTDPVTIASGGTLLTHGAVSLAGTVTTTSGGTLRVKGQATGGHTVLTVANGFTNNGLIDLISADAGYGATLNITAGTLTNASGATIHSVVGAGGARTIAAQLDNQGTLDVDQDLTLVKADAAHTNSGAIDLSGGADLTVTQTGGGASFTNTGTVTLAANRKFSVSGGATLLGSGTVSGTTSSTLVVNNSVLVFTPNTVTIPMTLTSTSIGGGFLTIGTSQSVTLLNGGLSDPVTINSGGTLLTHGTVSLTGALTQSGTLRVKGQAIGGHTTLTVANGFTNDGLIELTSADAGYSSTLAVATGTLTNNFSGNIHSDVGTGGTRTIAAKLSNSGVLDVDQALTLNKADATHYNSNSIDLTNANLTVTQTGTSPSFGNGISGVITLGANRQLIITGGNANFIGSSVVQGQTSSAFVMTGGTLNFTPAHVTVPLTLTSTTISGGTVTIANTRTVTLRGGSLDAAVIVQSGGTLQAQGTAAASSVSVGSGGLLRVVGNATGGHASFTVDNGIANNGDIELTSEDAGYSSALNVTNGNLSNTGTILSNAGTGGTRTIGAQLDNQGTLDVNQALTLAKADADHVNSGYIDLTAANMTVTQTGTTPTFTNNGTIQLATSRTFTVGGGVLTNAGGDPSGTIQGPGTVNVSTAAFTNHANINPAGTLNITGNYVQDVTNGGTGIVISNVTTFDKLVVSGTATLSGSLNVTLNAFTPLLGQTYQVMQFASSTGTFSTTNLPDLTGIGLQWQIDYNATNVTLKLVLFP